MIGPISPTQADLPDRLSDETQQNAHQIGDNHTTNRAGRDVNQRIQIYYGAEEVVPSGPRKNVMDRRMLEESDRRYVAPPGITTASSGRSALEALRAEHLMILGVRRDDGHRAAMKHLAFKLISTDDTLAIPHEFPADEGFRLTDAGMDSATCSVVMVDLHRADSTDVDRARTDLGSCLPALRSNHSYLVLAVPRGALDGFRESYPERVFELSRPDPGTVLRERLRGTELATMTSALVEELPLDRAWPPEVAELAQLLCDSYDRGTRDIAELARHAVDASHDWSTTLHEQVPTLRGRQRATLVAAAALENAGPAKVVRAANLLMTGTGFTEDPVELLDADSVTSQCAALEHLSFDPARARFGRPRYAVSVLRHVWSEYPDLQDHLVTWLRQLPIRVKLTTAELTDFVDTVLLAAIEAPLEMMTPLARAWACADHSQPMLRSLAVRLLVRGACDDRVGRDIRQWLYHQSYNTSTPQGMRIAVAQACGSEFGTRFDKSALVRLKHLTGSDDEPVNSAVLHAVLRIGENIGAGALLGRLLEWFDGSSPRRTRVLVNIWEELAKDVACGGNANTASEFFDQCFRHLELHEFARVVRAWIAAVGEVAADSERARCVNAIVGVAVAQPSRMARLWYVTRPPAPESDGYEAGTGSALRLLWTRLDESDPFLAPAEGAAR